MPRNDIAIVRNIDDLRRNEAGKRAEEIRVACREAKESAGRARAAVMRRDEFLKQAYADEDWRTLGYESWSAYVDGEFGESGKSWRSQWRAYGQVADALGLPVNLREARVIRPHLTEVKERLEAGEELDSIIASLTSRREELVEEPLQQPARVPTGDLTPDTMATIMVLLESQRRYPVDASNPALSRSTADRIDKVIRQLARYKKELIASIMKEEPASTPTQPVTFKVRVVRGETV